MSDDCANQNPKTQTNSKDNQSEPKRMKPTQTKPRKRRLIVYEWCFWVLVTVAGIVFFVNHKFAIASIPVLFIGLIFGAFALRLSLINNGSTFSKATMWWWIFAVPSFLFCSFLFCIEIGSSGNEFTPSPITNSTAPSLFETKANKSEQPAALAALAEKLQLTADQLSQVTSQRDVLNQALIDAQSATQPRRITLEQRNNFIALLSDVHASKISIKVIVGNKDSETENFAGQFREMLDAAGYGKDAPQSLAPPETI